MINNLLFYFTTLFAATSLTIVIFKTSFLCEVISVLKRLGFKKNDKIYWAINPEDNYIIDPSLWTTEDFQNFCNFRLGLLGRLLTCRYCFSCHAVFWSNLVIWGIMAYIWQFIPFYIVVIAMLSQLPLLHIIYGIETKLTKGL